MDIQQNDALTESMFVLLDLYIIYYGAKYTHTKNVDRKTESETGSTCSLICEVMWDTY